eukprot:TRINITY_DN225_c0_g2_i1.p1 TRINITY_DN225_c0_g2~~TRINITY_DN225_c0_g2_i1.p1  ORF type:complete len:342 (-),score=84.70 TRINITY_DN225_c0_g2_i1:15-1019(-)
MDNKSLLDELMGKDRDLLPDEIVEKVIDFMDRKFCSGFLLDCCPHDMFTNTRSDLRECPKIHSQDAVDELNKKGTDTQKVRLMQDAIPYLEKMIRDADRKVASNKFRLDDEFHNMPVTLNEDSREQEMLKQERITKLQAEAESMGEEGDVEGARRRMAEVERMMAADKEVQRRIEQSLEGYSRLESQMMVCDVCGAFVMEGDHKRVEAGREHGLESLDDKQSRHLAHIGGKVHLGYVKIRQRLAEFQEFIEKQRGANNSRSDASRSERPEPPRSSRRDRYDDDDRHLRRESSSRYDDRDRRDRDRSDREIGRHTSELQSHSFISYAVFCLKKKK